jgi:transcriptional regulator with XRE-family HTH domain
VGSGWTAHRADAWRRQLYEDVGRSVRIAREAEGLTLAELARRCGTSASTLGKVELGDGAAPFWLLVRIADELDTTLDNLTPITMTTKDEEEAAE